MTNRQWICEILAHQESLGTPYNFPLSPRPQRLLEDYYRTTDLAATLDLPLRMRGCKSIKPLYASPAEFGDCAKDEYGVVWSTNEIDRGSPIGPCLPEPDLSGYSFPDPAVERRFEDLGAWCEANRQNYRMVWVGDLFERATFMRGMEGLMLDVAFHAAFVEELLRGIADYVLQTMRILFDRFQFDGIALSDDYGTQRAMLISPRDWRSFVKPRLSEIYSLAKAHGRTVLHHTCGNVRPIVGDLIDIGLDILHPIQPEAMDIFELKRAFGRDLTFCGGLRTQDLLPRGTPEDIRTEVRRLKQEMGRGGGYILEPGITIQADVPLENLIALIEAASIAKASA